MRPAGQSSWAPCPLWTVHSGEGVPVEIKGIKADEFDAIVRHVSEARYERNVMCNDPRPSGLNAAGTRFRQRVIVASSRGAGARRSWSGRRMPCACWHVFRDVVRATLAAHPAVTFRTSLAYYTSDNFEATYPATGTVNVGSMGQPAYLPDLCECDDDDNGDEPSEVPVGLTCRPSYGQYVPAIRETSYAPSAERHAERDQELAIAAHECAWCGGSTAHLGDAFAWCTPECQERWQAKYGAGLATR